MATGSSMLVAVKALRSLGPARIVAASGVSSPTACAALTQAADECVCVLEPPDLGALAPWYEEFEPISDEEVRALLGRGPTSDRGEGPRPARVSA